jgi:quinoprotein glucose dehydrogenase
VKPPWGKITAIDLDTGEFAWDTAHGETPDEVRNHPALKGLAIPRTVGPGNVGTLVTRTLVIAGEGGFVTASSGLRGAMLRAYDKATRKEAGAVFMPGVSVGSADDMHVERQTVNRRCLQRAATTPANFSRSDCPDNPGRRER